jgi:DNA invertase Pin-like site-specific DNA recombinase
MEKNTHPKAVIYCRVSTKEQVEEGNSLATQERNCREYANKNSYDIAQVFIEEGESAKTAERTELQKLLRFCSDKKQQIKAVIIYKIDRLSRNTDDYSQLRLLLKRYGVEIKSTSEYFENTPAGRFMENIIANVAQFDNDVRTERSVGGMREAVKNGRYVWMAPIGYNNQKVDGKANIVQNDKAPLVKLAFEMMADRKYSVNIIYEKLYSMGLTISKAQFYKTLNNELYTGWISKLGEHCRGTYNPIISEELFTRVQQVMRNKVTPLIYKNEHPDFPLRRFVMHPKGHKLTGAWSSGRYKKYAYYRFVGIKLQWPKNALEASFCSFMDKYAFDENLLTKLKTEMINRFSDKSENKKKDIEGLSAKKQQLKEKQNILLQKNIKGVISDTLLKEQLAVLDEEIWNIDKSLTQNEEDKIDIKHILQFLSEYLLHPSTVWRNMPLEIKIKLQWFQFPEGVILDEKELRTTKISSIFKLKEFFLGDISPNVHYPILNYKHENQANSPPLQNKESVVWNDVKKELVFLEELLKVNNNLTRFILPPLE